MPYKIPVRVALTTALAAGGLQPLATGGIIPIPANANIQDIVTAGIQTLAAGASVAIAWPAVPAGQKGEVVQIAWTSSDPANVSFQTRVNGIGVQPYPVAHFGSIGTILNPYNLVAPIILQAGQVFDIFVTNTSGVPITFQTRALGAFFT